MNDKINQQQLSSCNKSENDEVTSLGFKHCLESKRIKELQSSFGQLCRVGALGDFAWTTKIPTKAKVCRYIFAHPLPETWRDDQSLSKIPESVEDNVPKPSGKDNFMVVDTFASKIVCYRVALFVGYELSDNSKDPEKLTDDLRYIAEYGFNHIIFIGEVGCYGILFMDCLGRVFWWDEDVLWPLGNSLEEAKLNSKVKEKKDKLMWIAEDDGIVYESKMDI